MPAFDVFVILDLVTGVFEGCGHLSGVARMDAVVPGRGGQRGWLVHGLYRGTTSPQGDRHISGQHHGAALPGQQQTPRDQLSGRDGYGTDTSATDAPATDAPGSTSREPGGAGKQDSLTS